MITIGFLELNSISKGILAADEMIKAADHCSDRRPSQLSGKVPDLNYRRSLFRRSGS